MGRGFLNGWGGAPNKLLFLYRQRRTFFTAKGRFLYRRGGCRHARHDGGDGGDGKEENSFSDFRHRHPRQGEADSHRHGFLYLYQPIIEVSINGFTPQLVLHKQQPRLFVSASAKRCPQRRNRHRHIGHKMG